MKKSKGTRRLRRPNSRNLLGRSIGRKTGFISRCVKDSRSTKSCYVTRRLSKNSHVRWRDPTPLNSRKIIGKQSRDYSVWKYLPHISGRVQSHSREPREREPREPREASPCHLASVKAITSFSKGSHLKSLRQQSEHRHRALGSPLFRFERTGGPFGKRCPLGHIHS